MPRNIIVRYREFQLKRKKHWFHADGTETSANSASGEETLEEVEERTIRAAMERYNGNLTHVAKSLNISRPTLYTKLKKYNI